MIIVGDLAVPDEKHLQRLKQALSEDPQIFSGKSLIFNLEGPLFSGKVPQQNIPILYNHPELIKTLSDRGQTIACLANNHMSDIPHSFESTIDNLKENKVLYGGAGRSPSEAMNPITFTEFGKEIVIFNSCWDFLLNDFCVRRKSIFVSKIDERQLLESVAEMKGSKKESFIIIFLHWNLDLEVLPFPAHRQFARLLIENGANLVIGAHSHCIQGGEIYKDGYIIYGLGNFYIPHNEFASGKIFYPSFSDLELVLEWDCLSNEARCHWFNYMPGGILKKVKSERFEDSSILKKFSPFTGMSDRDYIRYFRRNRRKKFLVPVYKDIYSSINIYYTYFLFGRKIITRTLARLNIINWQR